ncbi:Spy/CpxP family protein refolding chaperone [Bradyrhizobium sp. BTAi1]|uniref:Spy/CpxP family protein refolding chaperone n=1 Tax=Bradyrhizobium sp. (strain BTAi1 / ATCC BAA-1182) TaxID=288000 RepID=UPI000674D54D|nr:periplasmic heavy metal sensor [Bradyrhizobium sp. BTAi1]
MINSGALAAQSLKTAMMDDMKEMGSMGPAAQPNPMPGMGATSGNPSAGMGGSPLGGMESGCCMGSMGQSPGAGSAAASGMSMQTNLPGFPGASHIYHVGATGFYLEYADKLGLSTEQRTSLNDIKQRALVEQSNQQRKIDEAEQALWLLTAAEQPDAVAIEAKVREIEKVNADQRLSFIRSVGDAAKSLTADQRKVVLGLAPMPGAGASSTSAPPKQMNMGK